MLFEYFKFVVFELLDFLVPSEFHFAFSTRSRFLQIETVGPKFSNNGQILSGILVQTNENTTPNQR